MCGIAGVYSLTGASSLPIARLSHRGPDALGEWRSPNRQVWFGHARLAIVDLRPQSNQPMLDPVTGNAIVFNGEIYNHQAIRNHPQLANIDWRGTSDTETILVGYRVFGKQIVSLLKGMFAFLIWDEAKQQLFAARDRLGIKPLYYTRRGNIWSFSSETRILESQGISKTGLALYLRHGSCQDEQLILEGIEALPSGCTLTLDPQEGGKIEKYWLPQLDDSKANISVAEAKFEIRKALEISAREHLLADVPVASFLSGGIDSSIVTALAAKYYPGTLKTFSLGFAQANFDETAIAKKVSEKWSTQHTRIQLEPHEVCQWVKESVAAMDLPSVDAINTYIISKAVRLRGVKVALSGLGGDELFGGYPSFKEAPYLRLLSFLPKPFGQSLGQLSDRWEKVADIAGKQVSLQTAAVARRIFTPNRDLESINLPTPALSHYGYCYRDRFGEISWAELRGYMQNMLLRDTDQMSMAVSLETRVPFLDHEFVELCLSVGEKTKCATNECKSLLVESCRDLLVPEVYQRQKQGFVLPMNHWLRNELQEFSDRGLAIVLQSFPQLEFLQSIQTQFSKGKLSWPRYWQWVVLGHWLAQRQLH